MAVDFPSDLILDVARAADPASVRNLETRLRAGTSAPASTDTAAVAAKFESHLSRAPSPRASSRSASSSRRCSVSNMIQNMMGETDESYFGDGLSSNIWKSMMAEQVADQVVQGADFGVASKIGKYVVSAGDKVEPLTGVRNPQASADEARMLDAARRSTQEVSRDFIIDVDVTRRRRRQKSGISRELAGMTPADAVKAQKKTFNRAQLRALFQRVGATIEAKTKCCAKTRRLTKPFSPGELMARVRAMLRRPRASRQPTGACVGSVISRSIRRHARRAEAASQWS